MIIWELNFFKNIRIFKGRPPLCFEYVYIPNLFKTISHRQTYKNKNKKCNFKTSPNIHIVMVSPSFSSFEFHYLQNIFFMNFILNQFYDKIKKKLFEQLSKFNDLDCFVSRFILFISSKFYMN